MFVSHTCRYLFVFVVCLGEVVQILSTSTVTSPVFFWANNRYFSDVNLQVADLLDASEVLPALKSQDSSSNFLQDDGKAPEVFVVYVEPHLQTEQVSLVANANRTSNSGNDLLKLQYLIEDSASSIVFPYVSSFSNIAESIISSLISTLPPSASIIVAKTSDKIVPISMQGKKDVHIVSLDQLKNQLSSVHSDILHNGISDLVVIYFDAPTLSKDHNTLIGQKIVNDVTTIHTLDIAFRHTKYVSILTAENLLFKPLQSYFPESHESLQNFDRRFVQVTGNDSGTRWPAGVIEGLIVSIPFLLILWIAVYCTCGLQSVVKFDLEKNFLAKQSRAQ